MKIFEKLRFGGLLILLIVGAGTAGCTLASMSGLGADGMYVNEKLPEYYIELRPDSTFSFRFDAGTPYAGKWKIVGNHLQLIIANPRMMMELEKQGNMLLQNSCSTRVIRYVRM